MRGVLFIVTETDHSNQEPKVRYKNTGRGIISAYRSYNERALKVDSFSSITLDMVEDDFSMRLETIEATKGF